LAVYFIYPSVIIEVVELLDNATIRTSKRRL